MKTIERIEEYLKNGIPTKRCSNCGTSLPSYPFYNETHEIYICPKCNMIFKKERWNKAQRK